MSDESTTPDANLAGSAAAYRRALDEARRHGQDYVDKLEAGKAWADENRYRIVSFGDFGFPLTCCCVGAAIQASRDDSEGELFPDEHDAFRELGGLAIFWERIILANDADGSS